jgi:hypothetical protein
VSRIYQLTNVIDQFIITVTGMLCVDSILAMIINEMRTEMDMANVVYGARVTYMRVSFLSFF